MPKYPYTVKYYKKKIKPDVAVIICSVARPKGVMRGLRYLSRQTFNNFEVIIVDGVKSNELDKVCRKYSDKLFIKRVVINKRNLPYSRNKGISACTASVIAFHDDDAYSSAGWLANLLNAYSENREFAGIGGAILSANKSYLSLYAQRLFDYGSHRKQVKTITGANMSFNLKRLGNLKNYKRQNIFNEEYSFAGEETDACYAIVKARGKLIYVPGVVVYHDFETNLTAFIKKHYSYGEGDYKVTAKNDFQDLYLIGDYLSPVRNFKSKSIILLAAPLIVLRKVVNFARIYGAVWIPAALLRESVYAAGLYGQLLKEDDALSKI